MAVALAALKRGALASLPPQGSWADGPRPPRATAEQGNGIPMEALFLDPRELTAASGFHRSGVVQQPGRAGAQRDRSVPHGHQGGDGCEREGQPCRPREKVLFGWSVAPDLNFSRSFRFAVGEVI